MATGESGSTRTPSPAQSKILPPTQPVFANSTLRESADLAEPVLRESAERTEVAPALSTEVVDGDAPFWPDETAEVAFLSDAKERGESPTPVAPAKPAVAQEESETKTALPSLDDMVKRIPTNVRETLEELFRAKFVQVKRVPKKSLKS